MNEYLSPRLSGTTFSGAVLGALMAIVLFSVLAYVFGIPAGSDGYIYLGYLLPSIAVGLVTVFVMKFTHADFSALGGFYAVKFKKRYFAVVILATFGMLFGLGKLNDWFIKLLGVLFGYVEQQSSLPDYSVLNLILTILVIAVVPPIVEETVFRGIIQSGLKKSGYMSVILTAALFALYHLSPAKTIYQFAAGLIFSLICLKSGSVVPSLVIHVLNNLLIILSIYFNIFAFAENYELITTIVGLICLAVALVIILTDKTEVERSMDKADWGAFLINASVGLFIGSLIWIISVFVH